MTAINDVFYSLFCSKIQKFATESTQTSPRELMIKKNFKFSTSEFTKICHLRYQIKKFAPPQTPAPVWRGVPGVEGKTPSPHPTHFGFHPPTLNSRWRHWSNHTAFESQTWAVSTIIKCPEIHKVSWNLSISWPFVLKLLNDWHFLTSDWIFD